MNLTKLCRCGLFLAGAFALSGCGADDIVAPEAKATPNITISKETTYITEPLTADGYPDYVAALNHRTSRGVTPENNAVVLLMQAFGPKIIPTNHRPQFFQMLGIPPLPEEGDYFIDYETYVKEHDPDASNDQHDAKGRWQPSRSYLQEQRAGNRAWREKECPLVAEWLAANEKPLARIIEASHRSHFYIPAIMVGTWELEGTVGAVSVATRRVMIDALLTRAFLHTGEGNEDRAWSDLLACHRLSRNLDWPAVAQYMFGPAAGIASCWCSCRVSHDSQMTTEQTKRYWDEMAQLPPYPSGIRTLCDEGRREYLDAICSAVRGTSKAADVFGKHNVVFKIFGLNDPYPNTEIEVVTYTRDIPNNALARLVASGLVDWNEVLRLGNEHFDRIAAASRLPTWPEKHAALKALEHEVLEFVEKHGDHKLQTSRGLPEGLTQREQRTTTTQRVSAVCLASFLYNWGFPRCMQKLDIEANTRLEMMKVALALSAYRTEHGEYPENLDALMPKFLAQLPLDPFGSGPLHYRRQDNGYLLYSVGLNGKDDTGPKPSSYIVSTPPQSWANSDDIGIRMPDEPYED